MNTYSPEAFTNLVDEVAKGLNVTPSYIDENHVDLGVATLLRFPNSGEVVVEQQYLVRPFQNLTAAESLICHLSQRRRERTGNLPLRRPA